LALRVLAGSGILSAVDLASGDPLFQILAGCLAGLVHVLSGPDHLAAITPLAASRPKRSWRTGALWGTGHTGGVWLVALGALLLRGVLPIDRLSSWSERLVGIVLIAIGLWGLRQALRGRVHVHEHEHDGAHHAHLHAHRHAHATASAPKTQTPHVHTHAALGVGVLHGLAGSAHFLGVLPALALPTNTDALLYVFGFGAGTVAAMAAYAGCIGAIARRTAHGTVRSYRVLLGSSAGAAVVVGCIWLAASVH
jgi:ABC-type nickel/cobalt efflux system permease component RcnA